MQATNLNHLPPRINRYAAGYSCCNSKLWVHFYLWTPLFVSTCMSTLLGSTRVFSLSHLDVDWCVSRALSTLQDSSSSYPLLAARVAHFSSSSSSLGINTQNSDSASILMRTVWAVQDSHYFHPLFIIHQVLAHTHTHTHRWILYHLSLSQLGNISSGQCAHTCPQSIDL